jgi:protein ImuB
LAFLLSRMLEQLCARLQSRALATHELRLKLQLDPDVTVDREGLPVGTLSIPPFPAEGKDGALIPAEIAKNFLERTIKLPVPMLDAKAFLKLLQLDLKANPPKAPVLKLWLRAEPVRPRYDQHGLFLPLTPEPQKLELTLARLAGVVGGQNNVGSPEVMNTHRPGAFRMTRFAPPAPNYETDYREASARPMSALRRFRPSQPVSVLMIAGKPGTIGPPRTLTQSDEMTCGVYGEVVWCAGPWYTSGEWWDQERWEREEWDVSVNAGPVTRGSWLQRANPRSCAMKAGTADQLPGRVLYRIYEDVLSGTWFVEGEYD